MRYLAPFREVFVSFQSFEGAGAIEFGKMLMIVHYGRAAFSNLSIVAMIVNRKISFRFSITNTMKRRINDSQHPNRRST